MAVKKLTVARTLSEATRALDFETPLASDDDRYLDLSAGRGAHGTARLRKLFERKAPDTSLHAVFASHRGAGKSTELKRLASDLSQQFCCVYFEANVEMDANSFSMVDLLLVLARTVESQMRARGTPLNDKLLHDVDEWFAKTIVSHTLGTEYIAEVKAGAEAEGGIPFFAKLFASINALFRTESRHRTEVQNELRKYPGTFMAKLNSLLNGAAERLRQENRELLVVVDNMDRYSPDLMDQLLVRDADRFRQLRCSMVLTPPIGLVLQPKSQSIEREFPCEIMPTVRVREKDQWYDEFSGPGRNLLVEMLGRRIDLDALIPEAAARDRLVSASGGGVRELIEFAQDASLESNGPSIALDDVNRVLERRRQRLRDRMDANGWLDALLAIARTKRLSDDPKCLQVLFQRLAFHYDAEVWYDVHPLLGELKEFRKLKPRKKRAAPRRRAES